MDRPFFNKVLLGHNPRLIWTAKKCFYLDGKNKGTCFSITFSSISASISSEILIGDGASITIGSVVVKNVAAGQRVTGNFAIDHKRVISFLRKIR